jgi:hypothetical protein
MERNAAGLRRSHHRLQVVLGEHTLECDRRRVMFVEQLRNAGTDCEQALFERHIRRGANDAHVNERCSTGRFDIHDPDAATR